MRLDHKTNSGLPSLLAQRSSERSLNEIPGAGGANKFFADNSEVLEVGSGSPPS